MLCAKALALGLKQYFKLFFSRLNQINFFYSYEEGRGGGGSLKDLVGDHLIFRGDRRGISRVYKEKNVKIDFLTDHKNIKEPYGGTR